VELGKLTQYIETLYAGAVLPAEEFIAQTELRRFTPVIDTDVARFLSLLLRLVRPAKVLEVGTSVGYAATTMARVVQTWQGKVLTVEMNDTYVAQAQKNFSRWNVADTVEILHGDALTLLPEMKETFDFVFLDVFSDGYPQLLEPCLRVLNSNGVLLAEDTLDPVFKAELDGTMHTFNSRVAQHPDLISTLLPVGDGMTLALKI
jgi:predicted O-methyltransferase YrrM